MMDREKSMTDEAINGFVRENPGMVQLNIPGFMERLRIVLYLFMADREWPGKWLL
jgi:hypothetical protein